MKLKSLVSLAAALVLMAAPVLAAPACSECNCNTPCATACYDELGFWSACWSGPTCKEICELDGLSAGSTSASATEAIDAESFLKTLAAPETEGPVETAPAF